LEKTISLNRKAYRDYTILETVEAGIVLTGSEIKSIRAGKVSLGEAYAAAQDGEIFLLNAHIARYEPASQDNHEPRRPRKLLLHRDEIYELAGKVGEKGFTLVPLKLYIKNGIAKVELGLGTGTKLYDKREAIARRDVEREIERATKARMVKKRGRS
jgi:SsrA-binding protein